jgi:hypothetical protein
MNKNKIRNIAIKNEQIIPSLHFEMFSTNVIFDSFDSNIGKLIEIDAILCTQ